jgi:hypothetical protein
VLSVLAGSLVLVGRGYAAGFARRGAVDRILGACEAARAAALESGEPVYLLLWHRDFPEPDALLLARGTAEGGTPRVFLTGWTPLPGGAELLADEGSIPLSGPADLDADAVAALPGSPPGDRVAAVKFNGAGAVEWPRSPGRLEMFVGCCAPGGGGAAAAGPPDKITLGRFTGRARAELAER